MLCEHCFKRSAFGRNHGPHFFNFSIDFFFAYRYFVLLRKFSSKAWFAFMSNVLVFWCCMFHKFNKIVNY
jgi:hypothetical protein